MVITKCYQRRVALYRLFLSGCKQKQKKKQNASVSAVSAHLFIFHFFQRNINTTFELVGLACAEVCTDA